MVSQDMIEIYRNSSQMVNDAIDRVVVEVYKKKRELGHKTFLLTGSSAGCGTTTNAINLSVALANSGWRTILVDCDIRKGMQYKRLNEKFKVGLSDYLSNAEENCIFRTNYENMEYMPCGSFAESPVRLFCSQRMETLLANLKERYDFVILDFPSVNVVPDAEILIPFVDDVILIVALNETTRRQLDDAREKIQADKYMGIIANKVESVQYRHFLKDYDYFGEKKIEGRYKAGLKKKKTEHQVNSVEDKKEKHTDSPVKENKKEEPKETAKENGKRKTGSNTKKGNSARNRNQERKNQIKNEEGKESKKNEANQTEQSKESNKENKPVARPNFDDYDI